MLQARAQRGMQLLADRNQVFADIGIGGKREVLAAALEIAQPRADRQNIHLAAGIVDVVLALHAVARPHRADC